MPSKEHIDLAIRSLAWLRNRTTRSGIRGTTEVRLAKGYLADVAALCSLQQRFFQRYCDYSGLKPLTGHHEFKEDEPVFVQTGDIGNYLACVFEAKTSREDFLKTFNHGPNHANRHEPIGSMHWCVTPRGLIEPEELPVFWGLLEKSGNGLSEKKPPKLNKLTDAQFDSFAHKLIWPLQARRIYRY